MQFMETQDVLSQALAALAHPARRGMLERLSKSNATVKELAEPLDMSLPAVSKHIRVLERAGLISLSPSAQFRICTLNPEPLNEVVSWAERNRAIWEARFDQMEDVMKKISEADDGS